MESECHQLDLQLAQSTRGDTGDRDRFLQYSSLIHKITELEEEKHRVTEHANMLDSAVTGIALQLGYEDQDNPRLIELRKEAVHARNQLDTIVSRYDIQSLLCTSDPCPLTCLLTARRRGFREQRKPAGEPLTLTKAPFVEPLTRPLVLSRCTERHTMGEPSLGTMLTSA